MFEGALTLSFNQNYYYEKAVHTFCFFNDICIWQHGAEFNLFTHDDYK